MCSKWLIPFKGENTSSVYNDNFLWNDKKIYIMDNHRLATWCWLKEINKNENYNLFHVDKHFDLLDSRLAEWIAQSENLDQLSLSDYQILSYDSESPSKINCKVFRFDNYLPIFLSLYSDSVKKCYWATHFEGDEPSWKQSLNVYPWELGESFDFWINDSKEPWIINLDLDYFFYTHREKEEEKYELMFSGKFISQLFSDIKKNIDNKKISVLTIALSPECCGGWKNAKKLSVEISNIMGLDFHLETNS